MRKLTKENFKEVIAQVAAACLTVKDSNALIVYNHVRKINNLPEFIDYLSNEQRNWFLEFIPLDFEFGDFSKLNGYSWFLVLKYQPQFAEFCDWSKLDAYDWRELLKIQPQFVNHCDWSKFRSMDWYYLLIGYPQFGKYCDWSKLDEIDIKNLLEWQPQLFIN